jgi:hypothetical protein
MNELFKRLHDLDGGMETCIFFDEKKFNLDDPFCYNYYWHNLNLKKFKRVKRNCGGGTVEMWGTFTYRSRQQFTSVES